MDLPSGWTEHREFSLGARVGDKPESVRFRIDKLLPMPAYRLLRETRHALGKRLGGIEWSQISLGPAFVSMIMSLAPEDEESIRRQLFAEVYYRRKGMEWSRLGGDEDNAFIGMPAIAIYQVMVRAYAVNFTDSFAALAPGVQFVLRIIEQLTPGLSPDSSPPPSEPD